MRFVFVAALDMVTAPARCRCFMTLSKLLVLIAATASGQHMIET
jgi:hypothetical protein